MGIDFGEFGWVDGLSFGGPRTSCRLANRVQGQMPCASGSQPGRGDSRLRGNDELSGCKGGPSESLRANGGRQGLGDHPGSRAQGLAGWRREMLVGGEGMAGGGGLRQVLERGI